LSSKEEVSSRPAFFAARKRRHDSVASKNHALKLPQGNFGTTENSPVADEVMSDEIVESNFVQ
jgi:hypothetical protein